MRRRQFITLLGGAAAWPLAAHAQQGDRVRRIGMLLGSDQNDPGVQSFFPVIRQEFQKLGWIEGRNLRLHIRFGRTSMMPISLG
jgi:putative ABC transport system substrate-binding protein